MNALEGAIRARHPGARLVEQDGAFAYYFTPGDRGLKRVAFATLGDAVLLSEPDRLKPKPVLRVATTPPRVAKDAEFRAALPEIVSMLTRRGQQAPAAHGREVVDYVDVPASPWGEVPPPARYTPLVAVQPGYATPLSALSAGADLDDGFAPMGTDRWARPADAGNADVDFMPLPRSPWDR